MSVQSSQLFILLAKVEQSTKYDKQSLKCTCVFVDLTGSADGSVRLWEWEHLQPLTVLRAPGNFPKVTKVLFNAQGNKVIRNIGTC